MRDNEPVSAWSFKRDDELPSAYCIDICFVINATASMAPYINEVQKNVLQFSSMLRECTERYGYKLDEVRARVILYRDFKYDGAAAMPQSRFFNMPEEEEAFRKYVSNILVYGGGGGPGNALEALASAMRSPWTLKRARKYRHIIVLFTNAGTVPLRDPERTVSPYYPKNMPADLGKLKDWWEEYFADEGMPMKFSSYMLISAPNVSPWGDVVLPWDRTIAAFWSKEHGPAMGEVDTDIAVSWLLHYDF